jgi:hypothetical protein
MGLQASDEASKIATIQSANGCSQKASIRRGQGELLHKIFAKEHSSIM